MRTRGWTAVAALLVLLTGCSSNTVPGHPHSAARPTSTTPTSTTPTTPSGGTPSTTGTTAPAGAVGAQLDDPARVEQLTRQAGADAAAEFSYSYRNLPRDLAAGLAATTGGERAKFRRTFTTVVEKAAGQRHITQSFRVNAAGVEQVASSGRLAQVLLAAQSRITQRGQRPRAAPETVSVTVSLIGGRWLLADALPVTGSRTLATSVPPGNAALAVAAHAAADAVTDFGTLSRADFDADYRRAVSRTTGALRRELLGHEAATRRTLQSSRFDLSTFVNHVAVLSTHRTSVVLLIAETGYRSTTPSSPVTSTLEVTVRLDGAWLAAALLDVGLH